MPLILCGMAWLFGGSASAQEVSGWLSLVGKAPVEVELTSIDLSGGWQLEGRSEISAEQVVRFGELAPIDKGSVAVLSGGSEIVGSEFTAVGRSLSGVSSVWDTFSLPIRRLRGVLLSIPFQNEDVRAALDDIAAYDGQQDMLVFNNHDRIRGTFRRLTRQSVEIQVGEEVRQVERNKVAEIRFAQTVASGGASDGRGWVGFRDGSLIHVSRFTSADGRHHLTTTDGVELTSFAPINLAAELVYVQPQHDQVRFLSDLEPISYKHLGFLDVSWDFRADRNVTGGPLRSGGRTRHKGIGMHSTARLAYRVPPDAQRFKAEVAIDDSTQLRGSVIFRVFLADSSGQWNAVFESPVVRGGDNPLPVEVDLQETSA
ncbi:MAG: NPCBM/NEW2 domain-containing protein, partial [Pirellulaceae bacterium]